MPPLAEVVPGAILGTMYAGEMKKMVFSIMHYVLPKVGILSLHAGCNVSGDGDDCTHPIPCAEPEVNRDGEGRTIFRA